MTFGVEPRKLFLLVVGALLCCTAVRASAEDGLYMVRVDGKVGFIDKHGKIVIKPTFDDGRKFQSGIAPVKVAGQWGFIDTRGGFLLKPEFPEARNFTFGLAPVRVGDRMGYINEKEQF